MERLTADLFAQTIETPQEGWLAQVYRGDYFTLGDAIRELIRGPGIPPDRDLVVREWTEQVVPWRSGESGDLYELWSLVNPDRLG